MNREFVAITVNERESRFWRVEIDKYSRPCRVEPFPDGYDVDISECVALSISNPAPTSNEVLTILRRRFMFEHRLTA